MGDLHQNMSVIENGASHIKTYKFKQQKGKIGCKRYLE